LITEAIGEAEPDAVAIEVEAEVGA
jgi:hypothetical protein